LWPSGPCDITQTRKDGTRGRLRFDYGQPSEPEAAIRWLWKFVDAAKTPGELYGRTLVVIAAEQYATRLVLPSSQRSHPSHWGSHKQLAAKALKKLAGQHLPASLTRLERAVARAHNAYAKAERARYEELEAAPRDAADETSRDDTMDVAQGGRRVLGGGVTATAAKARPQRRALEGQHRRALVATRLPRPRTARASVLTSPAAHSGCPPTRPRDARVMATRWR
jgi:hypothetical protein